MKIKVYVKVEDSIVAWRFEYQKIGALIRNIRIPVWLLRVSRSPAWSASTHALQLQRTKFRS